jgi:hypothetical protein
VSKTLVLVHGRGFKPPRAELEALWSEAIRAGLARDAAGALPAFERCRREFVYFGDASNAVLTAAGRVHDASLDLADLKNALTELRGLARSRDFRRDRYERLPGKTPIKEFLADVGAPTLAALRLEDRAIGRFLPELVDYWLSADAPMRVVDTRLGETVGAALGRADDVAIVSHCIGSVFAYNALWALSRAAAQSPERDTPAAAKVALWLTLGAPLGDEGVKRRLDDARVEPSGRYPRNVVAWLNVAAEDDYVCHDDRVADDYREMLDRRMISRIDDARIYNLAVRYGRSNPHTAVGYLIHPRVSRALADWLGIAPIEP